MYIEASWPRVAGDNAKLEFSVPGNRGLSCLEFYYHMYGDTMGTLTVFSGSGVVFNASGNHGNTWIKAEITIHLDSIVSFKLGTHEGTSRRDFSLSVYTIENRPICGTIGPSD